MGLINFGAGLAAMGQSVANTAGSMALEAQRSTLETQKLQLAEQLRSASESASKDREFAHQDATTDKEIKSRETIARMGDDREKTTQLTADEVAEAGLPKGTVAQRDGTGKIAIIGSTAKGNEPLTDAGKLQADLDAGRITQKQYDAAFAKMTHEPHDPSDPLVEVDDGMGGTKFVTRQDAVGKPGKKRDKSLSDVVVPILQKVAEGKPLLPGERDALETYQKLGFAERLMNGLNQGGATDPNAPKAPGAAPPPAKPAGIINKTPPAAATPPAKPNSGSDKPNSASPAPAKPAAKAVPVPKSLQNEPDGTVVSDKAGNKYTKRGNQLIPQ